MPTTITNCPIVTSYAENIKNNMEELRSDRFDFRTPFLSFESLEILTKRLIEEFEGEKGMTAEEITKAAETAWEELRQTRLDICKKGEETLKWMEETMPTASCWQDAPTILTMKSTTASQR